MEKAEKAEKGVASPRKGCILSS